MGAIGALFFFSLAGENMINPSVENLLREFQQTILYLAGGFACCHIIVFSIPSKEVKECQKQV